MSRQTPILPDYGFNDGIRWRVSRFQSGHETALPSDSLSRKEVLSLPNSGQDALRDAEVIEEMTRSFVEHVGTTAVEMCVVGPENPERIMISLYGWGGNTRHPVAVNEAMALRANNPDTQIVYVNTPGAGRSSLLPKSVEKQIAQEGSWLGQGEILAKALSRVIDGRKVDLRGHSLGARQAVAMAPFIESGAETMILNDPTGARRLGLAGIANSFILQEGRHLGNYLKVTPFPEVAEAQKAPISSAMKDTLGGTKGSLWHQIFVDPRGLSKGGLETDLSVVIPHIEKKLRIISPEYSALNAPEDVANILKRVSGLAQTSLDIEQFVLEGHTHSWIAAAPAVEGYLYSGR